jgi:AraC-like DNA-binding protein
LSEQGLAVFEVAAHMGFADVHHFSRVFKQMTGISPSHYSQQQR